MEWNYELTGYPLCTAKYPKIERHILKYMKYYVLGVQAFIYIILMIAYNVIMPIIVGPPETTIELTWWYFLLTRVVTNLILGGFLLYLLIRRYPVVKAGCEEPIMERVQQRIQWDDPCTILFNTDSFTIISEEFGEKEKQIAYKDSEWIKAQDNIICISHNIIAEHISEDVMEILQPKLFSKK